MKEEEDDCEMDDGSSSLSQSAKAKTGQVLRRSSRSVSRRDSWQLSRKNIPPPPDSGNAFSRRWRMSRIAAMIWISVDRDSRERGNGLSGKKQAGDFLADV